MHKFFGRDLQFHGLCCIMVMCKSCTGIPGETVLESHVFYPDELADTTYHN